MYVNVSQYLVKTCKRVTLNCYMLVLIVFEIGINIPPFFQYKVVATCLR